MFRATINQKFLNTELFNTPYVLQKILKHKHFIVKKSNFILRFATMKKWIYIQSFKIQNRKYNVRYFN